MDGQESHISSALFKEQCDNWFKRETRSGAKSDENQKQVSSLLDFLRPLSQSQISEASAQTSSTKSAPKTVHEFESCAGCDPLRNEMITSKNYVKILANNISICNRHRVVCEALLDMQKCDPNNKPPYPLESLFNDSGPRFSVNEDRRLRKAVKMFGEDCWSEIAATGEFAFGRTIEDLRNRWFKLCEMNYDEN